jgi:hypothetical protein
VKVFIRGRFQIFGVLAVAALAPGIACGPNRARQDPSENLGRVEETTQTVRTDLCKALVDDDRPALRRVVDDHLKSLASGDSVRQRVEKLREWVSGQPCVASAELLPVLLDTEPPIQQMRVVLAGEGHQAPIRSIDIVLDPAGPRFNYR